ncbi:cysteine--tRNA ligase [Lachnoclostridium sp. Marseille-P6806]|uniref:cysteine--tRNA ligase n=1 Tax=Lachnoclostridium sp. Marseille-P6806 TaxID=2364793 RepID=UPI00102F4720|nr:cysteine--tRNA ligase [Lachnoclostridium sp. Marseille-P6806]
MEIYNDLSKQKEEFRPITPGEVKMYVCGPTVYNLIHIGNARPMIFFDTVRRYFEYRGYRVRFVSNFTDIDDKIIQKANEEGVDASVISERYIAECRKDMETLNVRTATVHPQATQEIQGMIDMIQSLVDKGFAYAAADGTVYYRTRKFPEYGKLSHRNVDDLRSGARTLLVTGEDQKEDPLDFVLWKPKKEGEPYWTSPWCDGRPGWHIECSVMSKRYLGDTMDIHGGGEDLIFPHHENEIAQSEASNGAEFARYWMHNAFLNIDNHKMSKSAGNFFTVRDITSQYDPNVVRYFMLTVHYRSPLNFSRELMESAKTSYERICNCAANLAYLEERAAGTDAGAEGRTARTAAEAASLFAPAAGMSEAETGLLSEADAFRVRFEKVMDDDFNTADAISTVFDLVRWINIHADENSSLPFLTALHSALLTFADILGIRIEKENEADDTLASYVESKIAERQAARKARDFALADAIRDELRDRGIFLEDTKDGVKWKKA